MLALMVTRLCISIRHIPALVHGLYTFFVSSAVAPHFQTETGSQFTSWPLVGRRRVRKRGRRRAARKPRRSTSGQLLPARVVGVSRMNCIRSSRRRHKPHQLGVISVMPRARAKQIVRRHRHQTSHESQFQALLNLQQSQAYDETGLPGKQDTQPTLTHACTCNHRQEPTTIETDGRSQNTKSNQK